MNATQPASRADLHVHSRYSDRPSEWFLRRIGAPESFSEPRTVYDRCRAAGMDFVTLTDHNCIRGALEIADLPGTFLSSEITTYFPENECKIHMVVSGITERDFGEIRELRANIYELRDFLRHKNIVHTVAHPLFRVNDKLDVELFEKLILLFDRFETINGSRDPRACDLAAAILRALTPADMEAMADRHGITPVGLEPWNKVFTGGSDDHSGLYIAGAHTVTPHASNVFDFLQFLREGQHEPGGRGGSSIRLANSLYKIAYSYYRSRFMPDRGDDHSVVGSVLRRLSGEAPPPPVAGGGWKQVAAARVTRFFTRRRRRQLGEVERLIVDEFTRVLEDRSSADGLGGGRRHEDNVHFYAVCEISQQLAFRFMTKFADKIRQGNLIDSLQSLSSLGPVLLGLAPYFTAFSSQHKDEGFLRAVADRFSVTDPARAQGARRAWVTDTFADVNGVSHTIRTLADLACRQDESLTVVTCLADPPDAAFPVKNFKPVGAVDLPEYESQSVSFPPFLECLAWFEEQRFDEVIISTPGTLGLCALWAAGLLGIPVRGIYHTDFPQYVRNMTEDDALGEITWKYMRWFYGGMTAVYAPTHQYRRSLMEGGFEADRLKVLPRGVNLHDFNPERRDPDFWREWDTGDRFTFLYVGRVSREKNLDVMLEAFRMLCDEGADADLAVVGDGPFAGELRRRYHDSRIVFTGTLTGDRLSAAYASADAFVFPSRTDTFGNAVLEAHASGLPAIVSDCGGPQEIVGSHHSGIIVDTHTPDALAQSMRTLLRDRELYETLRSGALARARDSRWEQALSLLLERDAENPAKRPESRPQPSCAKFG
ncbi:glycosyltransferase [Kiritimatiella glycovorans]|uniref:Glycosyltransferase n=1 Tax=Kiritimatiella glycovorans TaxID=1307763 RepID=A0A0G3EMM6_9BACT|nr:glycosyltransferase [Kiritimatiella glycovorans]AKJ65359.1 Glycosyltransferase [Kiritimatiella glycovorans]